MTTISPVLFYQTPVNIKNGSTQVDGSACEYGSCRGCNKNLASDNPASQYQKQKLIQNTVRVQASLYTMNLAGLSGYQSPLSNSQFVEQNGSVYLVPPKVYWNQMSDRAKPANQVVKIGSGSTYHGSSTRHSITRHRPGAMSPGGVGCDIKHNSYDRYLNRLKGKGPLRRGVIPVDYGAYIPFNRAYPVYGGKVIKTSIINGCDCISKAKQDELIYNSTSNNIQNDILSVKYEFKVGDYVSVKIYEDDETLYKGQIISINGGYYNVNFDGIIRSVSYCDLIINPGSNIKKCNINKGYCSLKDKLVETFPNSRILTTEFTSENNIYCNIYTNSFISKGKMIILLIY